jgi:pyrimidine-specific ribonucleoside hydrolase
MNDGIQVSTGATLGHGLIKVTENDHQPSALFTYHGKTIQLSLQQAYRNRIATEIKKLVKDYGLESDKYWIEVRRNALRYWLEMDRHDMFDIVEL